MNPFPLNPSLTPSLISLTPSLISLTSSFTPPLNHFLTSLLNSPLTYYLPFLLNLSTTFLMKSFHEILSLIIPSLQLSYFTSTYTWNLYTSWSQSLLQLTPCYHNSLFGPTNMNMLCPSPLAWLLRPAGRRILIACVLQYYQLLDHLLLCLDQSICRLVVLYLFINYSILSFTFHTICALDFRHQQLSM